MKVPQQRALVRNLLAETDKYIELRKWGSAVATAREAGLQAERIGDFNGMFAAGTHLERFEDFSLAAHLLSVGGRLQVPSSLPEWDGSPLPGRTLLIIQRIRHIGSPIRLARFLPQAALRAGRCIVIAEPRLVSLFGRSFPQLEVREDKGRGNAGGLPEADVIASHETLWLRLAGDGAALVQQFTPLRPDPALVELFRNKYGRGRPLIGICWSSTNANKDLPGLADWAAFLSSLNATCVSLQYGNVAADVAELHSLSGREVIHDDTVDSLTDIDTFSAQVAAMDAVVTISNTGAHLAGALGKPMIVILDDKNHLMWPVQGQETAWYPSARLVRRQARRWADVFGDVRLELAQQVPNV